MQYVLKTLLYFDIFNYPLTSREIFRFLGANSVSEKDVVNCLNNLSEQDYVFNTNQFYSLQSGNSIIDRRMKGNAEASKYFPLALQQASLISKFPFVRAVFASGSFSKDYMDENSDLDFFIVTAPGRLWIARMLLVLYRRIALSNSLKYFCVNLFCG